MKLMKKLLPLLIFTFCILLLPSFHVNAATRKSKEVTAKPGTTSEQLQALLDYNKNNQYDLTIHIPAGTYELLEELRIYSNTTIIADKDAKLMKNHLKGALLANDLSNDNGGYTTSENITIIGGIWDSSKIALINKGTESFRFIHATNVTIKNATIRNVPKASHLITFAGVKNGTIDNCILYGYVGTILKEAIQLDIVHDDVIVPSMQADKIVYDDLACDNITITNNTIHDYPRAIGSHSSVPGVFHKNVTIANNIIYNIKEAAIKAYNYVNLTIQNNTIKNAAVGVLVYTSIANESEHYLEPLSNAKLEETPLTYNILIEGNQILDMKKYGTSKIWGDGIRVMGSTDRPLTGVSIKKNKIAKTERFGIYIDYAPGFYIGSNMFINTTRHALYADRSNKSYIYYNQVYTAGVPKSSDGGIGISYSNGVSIIKNRVKNAAKNGIFLYNESVGCVIKGNNIISAGDNAIAVNLNSNNAKVLSNKITGNNLSDSNNRGIFVYGANKAVIAYNTITGCKPKQEININGSTGSYLKSNIIY